MSDMQQQILAALRGAEPEEAVQLARRWTRDVPDSAQAWRWLGVALQEQGEDEAALDATGRALALAPEDAELHLQQAGLLLAQHLAVQAEQALDRANALDPNQFEAYLVRAHLALLRGETDQAEQLARTAARVRPQDPQLWLVEGIVALQRGDAPRALALLGQAARALPDDPRVLHALAFAYLRNGHLAFAEQAFRRLLERAPAMAPMRALLARIVLEQGRADEALAEAQALLALDEDNLAVQRLVGGVALQAGQPALAIAHLKRVLARAPDDRASLQLALGAWRRLGTLDDARATLEAALATRGDAHDLWLARLALEPVGGPEAHAVVQRWTEAMPGHVPALEALLRVHDMAGEGDRAEAVARHIVDIQPGHVGAEQRIVEALLVRDPPAAIAHVRAVIDDAPEDVRARVAEELQPWLGQVQDRAGQPADALATWQAHQHRIAGARLPLPPLGTPPAQLPPLAAVDPAIVARPLLVWGAPGAHVERLVAALAVASARLRGDRIGARPPADPLQRYDTLARLAAGELTPQSLVAAWRAALPGRGIDDGNVIDWLLWWDNALLPALRQYLPEGRLVLAVRDPRDMLLDWLASGAPVPLALADPLQAAAWLAAVLGQVATLHAQDLYPHQLLRMDETEADPQALAARLQQAFGVAFPALPVEPGRLPAGHWRRYAGLLAEPFALLTPVARRLGYPET